MEVDTFIETAPSLRFAFSIKAKVGPVQDLGQTARGHRRIIDIYSPSAKTIDALMKLDLPSGVDIEVKL